jgi:biopolymer transport protein ExbD
MAGELPVSSFSDIAFLLIIFFLLTTTLQQFLGIEPEMPSGEKSESQEQEKTNVVAINGGQLHFNDSPVSIGALERELAKLNLDDKPAESVERVILLEAVGNVPYEMYYRVMVAIHQAGGAISPVEEKQGGGG